MDINQMNFEDELFNNHDASDDQPNFLFDDDHQVPENQQWHPNQQSNNQGLGIGQMNLQHNSNPFSPKSRSDDNERSLRKNSTSQQLNQASVLGKRKQRESEDVQSLDSRQALPNEEVKESEAEDQEDQEIEEEEANEQSNERSSASSQPNKRLKDAEEQFNKSIQSRNQLISQEKEKLQASTGRPGRPSKKLIAERAAQVERDNQASGQRADSGTNMKKHKRGDIFDSQSDDQGSENLNEDIDLPDFLVENESKKPLSSEFKKFLDKEKISKVFSAMDDIQRERFETFRQSNFDEKKMKKLLSNILGATGKMNQNITKIIKSITKIYVGQLVEESKMIQMEEKHVEQQYQSRMMNGHQSDEVYQLDETEESTQDRFAQKSDADPSKQNIVGLVQQNQEPDINPAFLSQIQPQLVNGDNLGPIQPHHLMEARRRLLERGELVREKPQSMFKRR